MIEALAVTVRAGRRALLQEVSLSLRPGEVLALVGPNGAGKSTLLRVLAGELQPDAGLAWLCGCPLGQWAPLALARRRAVVSQRVALAFPLRAEEVVALGRLPWHGSPAMAEDAAAVAAAMAQLGIAHLAGRAYATLSGGEQQRVQIARALAQLAPAEPPAALLLDEPTASLDMAHSALVLHALRRLAGRGMAVLVVLHDLNEARFVADRVAVLAEGRCRILAPPALALQPGLLHEVYGIPFRHLPDGGLLADFAAVAEGMSG